MVGDAANALQRGYCSSRCRRSCTMEDCGTHLITLLSAALSSVHRLHTGTRMHTLSKLVVGID